MAHRNFTDGRGVHWEVWDVVPQWADRRTGDERRQRPIEELADPPVLEQRRGHERRHGDPPRGIPRVKIAAGFGGGWLAFESPGERRRLSPIPPNWQSASEAELSELCASARTAPLRRST
jgi:hypothetical protein